MTDFSLTRRAAIMSAAALPFAAIPARVRAAAEPQGPSVPLFQRYQLGAFEVVPLLAGTRTMPDPHGTFGTNASAEDFGALAAANHLPADFSRNYFTPVLVNTGAELVLFDTGLTPEGITAALGAAGYSADQVDVVVLSHMHGDHIGGIAGDEAPTFANARYVTGQAEWDHWATVGNEGFDIRVKPLAEKFSYLADGGDVVSGISARAAFGHTPGHMAWMLESEGQSLMLTADTVNHYVFSLQRPDWEVRFDLDKAAAAATRKSLLGQIAADKIPFIGYHMPFPALGYLEPKDEGFRFVPASYQLSGSE